MKSFFLSLLYRFLALCSRIYIRRHSPFIIAITWSVGKTSCRNVISEILSQIQELSCQQDIDSKKLTIYTSPENYNSELWLVFSVFQIEEYHPSCKNLFKISCKIFFRALFWKKNTDILVAEYWIDSPWDMERLLQIAVPTISILTKLDSVHCANFPWGIRDYWKEKWKLLFATPGKVYVNLQDDYSQEHYYLLSDYVEIWDETTMNFDIIQDDKQIVKTRLYHAWKKITLNLIGKDNIMYTKLAMDIAQDMWFDLHQKRYDFCCTLQPGRFSFFQYQGNIFIDSSYNAAPESMKLALENMFLIQSKRFPRYKIIGVLWDMRELWDMAEQSHKAIASYLKGMHAIYTVWPLMYEYLVPELKNSTYNWEIISSLSSRDIGKKLKKYIKDNNSQKYLILFKGSQNTIYTEEALAQILPKSQHKKLPRQSISWKTKKEKFFKEV